MTNKELETKCRQIRRDIINMTADAASGHPGGSLSVVEILACLYYNKMRVDPKNPHWEDRDRFVLSKGHFGCPRCMRCLRQGLLPREELKNFRQLHSILQGHPDAKKCPGIDASTGSLGQGISIAVGMAIGAKLSGKDIKSIPPAATASFRRASSGRHPWPPQTKLDNLTVFVDNNGLQIELPQRQGHGARRPRSEVRSLRLWGDRSCRRQRYRSGHGGARRRQRRQAQAHPLPYGQGQGRVLYGKSGRLARQGSERRGTRKSACGIGGLIWAKKKAIRVAYGEALAALGAENDKVVALDADLARHDVRNLCG